MWQVKITYKDFSELTFKGIEADIEYEKALFYFEQYVAGKDVFSAAYQQYPINEHKKIDLVDKIEELRQTKLDAHNHKMSSQESLGLGSVRQYTFDIFVSENDSPAFNTELITKVLKDAGFVVLGSNCTDDVTFCYEDRYPELVWKKVLETDESIFYRHTDDSENGTKMYSKISGRESSGYYCSHLLFSTIQAIANDVIQPVFICDEILEEYNLHQKAD